MSATARFGVPFATYQIECVGESCSQFPRDSLSVYGGGDQSKPAATPVVNGDIWQQYIEGIVWLIIGQFSAVQRLPCFLLFDLVQMERFFEPRGDSDRLSRA
jgi:hypothetical protein